MGNKKVFLWISGMDDFMDGQGLIGGLTLQMFFWGRIFAEHNWFVQTLTKRREMNGKEKRGIHFFYLPQIRLLKPLLEVWKMLTTVYSRPALILVRGATRSLGMLAFFCRLHRVKLVLFFASDSDVQPGAELISRPWDRMLFRWGIRNTRCFICQNKKQLELLEKNYRLGKYAVTIPNIWLKNKTEKTAARNAILWVSNFRDLKRPEWFLALARRFPHERFVMVGGCLQPSCYEKIRREAETIQNVDFLGAVAFEGVQQLFAQAKIFVCTSRIEGFPNTFLQAFSNGIPVLTTFDPSEIIKTGQLGLTAESKEGLISALQTLLNHPEQYREMCMRVQNYFTEHYSPECVWQMMLKKVGVL